MYLGLLWDTCTIHAKYQDTCILFECNKACKIHLRYIRIRQDTCIFSGYIRIHQDTYPITNVPKLDNKCTLPPPPSPTGGGRGRLPLRGRARRGPPQHHRPTARRPPTRGRAVKRIGKILPAVDVLQPPGHPLRKRGVRRVGRGGVRCPRVSSAR